MNKKKILIGLIVILGVFILACLFLFIYGKQQNIIESDFEIAESPEENIMIEDEITDVPVEEIAEETAIQEPDEMQEITETKVDTTSQKVASSPVKSKTTTQSQSQPQVKQETQTKTQIQTKTETIQPTQTQVQIEQPKVTEEKKEVVTTPPSQNTTPVAKDEEKYVRNDAMINRIKQVIESNESEYMKTYGYTVVIDSSIKEQANQFTFTETRVKGYITYRFGTIKIYAEDYYRNGQLIMTECYIF